MNFATNILLASVTLSTLLLPQLTACAAEKNYTIQTEPHANMEFVWVEGGCFQMGCGNWTDDCEEDEEPLHEVCLEGFWIGRYEVTQEQWTKVQGGNPSYFKKGGNYPVENITWYDAQDFITKLNAISPEYQFTLPTEAQWEYAARTRGRREKYSGSRKEEKVAWYGKNSGYATHPVGTQKATKLGIHDMSGNVWEWCQDGYDEKFYEKSEVENPLGPQDAETRVIRGGSHGSFAKDIRTSNRNNRDPEKTHGGLGVRLIGRLPENGS
jgi:formylglycine-generating enzyme required for sulfatase activity